MNSQTLAEHPFIQECFKDGLAASQALGVKKIIRVKPEYPRDPTEYEYFVLGVSSSAAQLLTICQDIEDSLTYLGTSNITSRMKKLGITKHRYIRHTIENFIVCSQSLYGRILYLIDSTFHLGNPDDQVIHRSIAGNVHVLMSPVANNLKKIKKCLEKYHFLRNEIIHHRSYDEDTLRQLEAFTILLSNGQHYQMHVKELSREIVAAKKREYAEFVRVVFQEIFSLLGSLKKEYDKRKKRLA